MTMGAGAAGNTTTVETETGTFTPVAGKTYKITVWVVQIDTDGTNNGPRSTDVVSVEAPPAPTTSFAPPLIGVGIAVLVVAVLGTVVVWRKRKEKKKTEVK